MKRAALHTRLSEFLGIKVSAQLASKWKREGLPVEDPPALRAALEATAASPLGKPENLKEELLREQILKIRADRLIKETQLEKMRGALVEAAEVERDQESVAAMVSAELAQAPKILPPMLEGLGAKAIERKLSAHMRKVVSHLRAAMKKQA